MAAAAGPSGRVGDMSETQMSTLDQFRNEMDDILRPEHDDYFCSRWLRARNFDLKESSQMLRKHLRWRTQLNIDNLEDYQPAEVLKKYFPGGRVGHDREGCPVWIIPFGHMDIKGLFYSMKKSEFILHVVWLMETSIQDMQDQSEKLEKVVDSHLVIFDMDGFTMKSLAWKPAVDMVRHLVGVLENNYPERLKKIYVVNAPKFFPMAYSLIKPFLSESTTQKIHVYIKDTWKAPLLEDVDPNELPVHWAGSMVGLDGNPRCPDLVRPGGQVPGSYYTAPSRRLSTDKNLTSVTIEKKSSLPIELNVQTPGSTIHWEFQTEDHDIGFGVDRLLEDSTTEELLPMNRVNCHLVPEDGIVVCDKPGKYVLKFDNSFSWCRRKRLVYQVEVQPPNQA